MEAMITLVIGTNRPDNYTRRVARHVEGIYAKLGRPVKVLDLADLPPEIFSPSAYAAKPAAFAPFAQAVLDAEGLVVVTPEYNGGMPGVLKYFIDMLKFPESFERRPVCFVGLAAGMWGALRPVEQLQQIFGYRNAHLYPERVFLPGVQSVVDKEGNFTDDAIAGRLEAQAKGFLEFVEKLRN
jgi:chromate reductase